MDQEETEEERLANIYRFGGFRYSLRGPYYNASDEIVPQLPGLYDFPVKDIQLDYDDHDDTL